MKVTVTLLLIIITASIFANIPTPTTTKSYAVAPISLVSRADEHMAIGIAMGDPVVRGFVVGLQSTNQFDEIRTVQDNDDGTATVSWYFRPKGVGLEASIVVWVDLVTRKILDIEIIT